LICGSNIKLYINGTLNASNSRTGTITSSSSTNINIAQKSDSTQRYGWQIDEVVIYNYALTPVLIKQLVSRGAGVNFGPESGTP
jgi:citrate lyase gamma subunit